MAPSRHQHQIDVEILAISKLLTELIKKETSEKSDGPKHDIKDSQHFRCQRQTPGLKPSVNESLSIHSGEVDSRVVSLQYLLVSPSLFRKSIGADLTHADSVSPAATGENKTTYSSQIVVLSINHE